MLNYCSHLELHKSGSGPFKTHMLGRVTYNGEAPQGYILITQPKQGVSSPPDPQAASDTDRQTSSAPSYMSIASII
jgi:hypothetical protein